MNIFLPDSLKPFIETQVTERGYRSSSEFVRDLIRHEQSREQLRALVVDRTRQERESELDDLYFDRLRAQMNTSGRLPLPTESGPLARPPAPDTVSTAEILDDLRADRL